MATSTSRGYREWSRYQWSSLDPVPDERDVHRWTLTEWVGDDGHGAASRPISPTEMPQSDAGFSGFGHNPSGNRWAEGYRR